MGDVGFWERMRIPDYTDRQQVRHGAIAFDYDRCNGCFLCRAACPASAITENAGKPYFTDGESECIFCGNCAAVCPRGTIALVRPYRYSGSFKTIDRLPAALPRL